MKWMMPILEFDVVQVARKRAWKWTNVGDEGITRNVFILIKQ